MAYALESGDAVCPVPYMIRNTFIDFAPAPDESPSEGVFSTWPRARPLRGVQGGDVRFCLDSAAELSDSPHGRSAEEASQQQPATREEGEIAEDGEYEDGELPDDERECNEDDGYEDGELPDEDEAEASVNATAASMPGCPPSMISMGSTRHREGTCRPCAWMHKSAAGCRNAERCMYCHLCPPGELKLRKKVKMQQRMEEAEQIKQQVQAMAESVYQAVHPFAIEGGQASPAMLDVLAMEPLYIKVPSKAQSVGSYVHGMGQCRPCAWVYKDAAGCRNSASCRYCHLCPPGELKRRKRAKWELQRSWLGGTPAPQ